MPKRKREQDCIEQNGGMYFKFAPTSLADSSRRIEIYHLRAKLLTSLPEKYTFTKAA